MILDMQQIVAGEGIVDFPYFVFSDLPAQPGAIQETNILIGTNVGTAQNITGAVTQTGGSAPAPPFPGT